MYEVSLMVDTGSPGSTGVIAWPSQSIGDGDIVDDSSCGRMQSTILCSLDDCKRNKLALKPA